MKVTIQGTAEGLPTKNVELTLSPTMVGNSSLGLVDLMSSSEDDTDTRRFPLTLEGSSEKTAKGVRRVMVKASVKLPPMDVYTTSGSVIGMQVTSQGTRDTEISLHAVLSVPKGIVFPFEGGNTLSSMSQKALQVLVTAIVSSLAGKQSLPSEAAGVSMMAEQTDHPLVRGLLGMSPYDTLTGDYGA